MLTQLYVANYKSIGDEGMRIQPRPLTILTGPNGAGKSSILEALCLLTQSVGNVGLRFDQGDYVRFSSPQSFLHMGDLSRLFQISLTIEGERTTERIDRSPGYFLGYRYEPNEIVQRTLMGDQEIVSQNWGMEEGGATRYTTRGNVRLPGSVAVDPRAILHPNTFTPSNVLPRTPEDQRLTEKFALAQSIQREIVSFLTDNFYFISAFRGASKFYLDAQSGLDPKWVGTDGSMTNQILSKIFGSRMYNDEADRIAFWAEKFSLGGLKAGWRGGGRLKSDYVEPSLRSVIDTDLASHGSRQALTFITQIFWSKPGTTLVIEEPEISLHPESQTLLPMLFAEAASRGVQIMITTHSPFVILELWKPVSENKILARDIAVYHVEKGGNGSHAKSLALSPDGHLKEWIPSFSSTETKLLRDFLDKVPAE